MSTRRSSISLSSALNTERRTDSSALRSTRHVEQMASGFTMERSGSRTGTHMAAPCLWLSDCADGNPKIIIVSLYEARDLTSR